MADIRAIGGGQAQQPVDRAGDDSLLLDDVLAGLDAVPAPILPEPVAAPEPMAAVDDVMTGDTAPADRWRWVAPVVAGAASIGWLGGMGWLVAPSVDSMGPVALAQLIAALCVPVVLIMLLWILAMRRSTAEARRFGATAQAMRAEAAALEAMLARVSARVEENRQALGAQAQAMAQMGERAADQLGATTRAVADQVARADAQARTLTEAAGGAENALNVLLTSLPRAHDETRTMMRTLEQLGLTAGERTAALDAAMASLTERGREADQVVGAAAQKLAAHIARMEATSDAAGARLEAVTGEMSDAVDALLGRTAGAVDEARKGIAAQGDAMLAMITANQAALDSAGRDTIEALGARIAAVDEVIARISERLESQRVAGDSLVRDLDHQFQVVEARVEAFHSGGIERNRMLAASISALDGSAQAMTETLKIGDGLARGVIGTTEDLLTALDSAAREIDETLPEALARLDARIDSSRAVVSAAKPELLSLVTAAESTHDAIEAIAQVIQNQRNTLDQLSRLLVETLATGRERAAAIGEMLDETIGRTHSFAEQAAPRLIEALIRVRDSAATAADRARETLVNVIPEAATQIENASAQAMQRAVNTSLQHHLAEIAGAADSAVAAAQRASDRLAEQMLTIAETSHLVDQRVEQARIERDQAETESFGRRASLLIEALNSASIDIAKHFSADVADSAWAAYLKGDRGVFTRRAVRLLDTSEAREIARLHDVDPAFREQVNRYIHDFEAMLRVVLAQRDGAPMGVTLLSSDMGKLYVALAQAIERLRT